MTQDLRTFLLSACTVAGVLMTSAAPALGSFNPVVARLAAQCVTGWLGA